MSSIFQNREVEVQVVNAFSLPDGANGNPAGVVLIDDSNETLITSDEDMLTIANKMQLAETAFVFPNKNRGDSDNNYDFEVRFFTTVAEVDFCGHATLGSWGYMATRNMIVPNKTLHQKTKAGILAVRWQKKDDSSVSQTIVMNQALPIFSQEPKVSLDKEEILKAVFECNPSLLKKAGDIDEIAPLPIQIVSTGLRDAILPLNGTFSLMDMIDNKVMAQKTAYSEKYDTIGMMLVEIPNDKIDFENSQVKLVARCSDGENTANKNHFQVRNFGPRFGVPEECATGSANGALASYLVRNRVVDTINENTCFFDFEFTQGTAMGLPSRIDVSIRVSSDDPLEIVEVCVGGLAVLKDRRRVSF